jgi:hypothetical protein
MQEFFRQFFVPVLMLIALAIVLTIVVFRKRRFDRGPRPAEPASPAQVKRDNPPDQWSRNH